MWSRGKTSSEGSAPAIAGNRPLAPCARQHDCHCTQARARCSLVHTKASSCELSRALSEASFAHSSWPA